MYPDLGALLVLGREPVEDRLTLEGFPDEDEVGREETCERTPSEKPES